LTSTGRIDVFAATIEAQYNVLPFLIRRSGRKEPPLFVGINARPIGRLGSGRLRTSLPTPHRPQDLSTREQHTDVHV